MASVKDDRPAVFTPDNEPYLGQEHLHTFDLVIPRAMQVHAQIGGKTFGVSLNSLQRAAAEIIPQGVSLSLSIRELLRQAYLYPAAVLLRPLVERTGTIQYLAMHPEAVSAWHSGWPRQAQPPFVQLVELVMPEATEAQIGLTKDLLHKLVHSDPKGSILNMFAREDGSLAFASGKELDQPGKVGAVANLASHCLRRLTATSAYIFKHEPGAV